MGISVHKIKKWFRMLTGKSIYHVNQGEGTLYSKTDVLGYYNDLTEKITRDAPDILVPKYKMDTGDTVYFSIGVFQYGLAAYDLYLKTKDDIYLRKLLACSDWALEKQQEDGSWISFDFVTPEAPYSSMAQGEGISMLIRAHIVTQNQTYLNAAEKALDFMLKPISEGGVCEYQGEDICFYEYTNLPAVLNGWIFSVWGLYDYYKYTNEEKLKPVLDASVASIKKALPSFDMKYWSKYDAGKCVASPFYHKLHIAQLRVMYDLFGGEEFLGYADRWEKYQKSFWNSKRAFVKKAMQKVFGKE